MTKYEDLKITAIDDLEISEIGGELRDAGDIGCASMENQILAAYQALTMEDRSKVDLLIKKLYQEQKKEDRK